MEIILTILHIILGLFGLTTSVLTMGALCSRLRVAKSPLGIAIANLAVLQLGNSVFGHLVFTVPSKLSNYWVYEESGCLLLGYMRTYFRNSIYSAFLLLSLERICCQEFPKMLDTGPFYVFALGIWIYNGVWTLIPVFWLHRYVPRLHGCEIDMDFSRENISVTIIINTATYMVPTLFMIYLLVRMERFKRERQKRVVKLRLPNSWLHLPEITRTTKILSTCAVIIYFLLTALQWLQLSMNDAVNSNRWVRNSHDLIEQAPILLTAAWYLKISKLWRLELSNVVVV